MGMVGFVVLLLIIALVVAIVKALNAESRIYRLEKEVEALKERVESLATPREGAVVLPLPTSAHAPSPGTTIPSPAISQPSAGAGRGEAKQAEPSPTRIGSAGPHPSGGSTRPTIHEAVPSTSVSQHSLEMILGTKWLNWVGMVMLLFGVGYFMKYAYDNAWIGPKGRLSIAVLTSLTALALGERFRRKEWSVLFQVFTGGALAALYLCVYFSFQVYHLSNQGAAFLLAVLVTAFAVGLAVIHNAVAIAILALVGGFLSPILLSTGENHPYALFAYIAILDLVAIATAFYRQWRLIDLLCLFGTVVMFVGWAAKFYGPDQMQPALIFTSLFYLMFLLIPTIQGLVNRLAQDAQAMMMILGACVLSFLSYFSILYPTYRYTLGFVTIAQALLVFLLFFIWVKRVGMSGATGASLLSIALGFVTIAIPIQLEFYGIPVAWAVEGAVLSYVAVRLNHPIPKIAGLVAFGLAVLGLFSRLPLHTSAFRPILNVPFGSWIFVLAMVCAAAYLWRGPRTDVQDRGGERKPLPVVGSMLALVALGLLTILLNMEVFSFWEYDYLGINRVIYQSVSLLILWVILSAALASITAGKIGQGWDKNWLAIPAIYYGGTAIAFLFCLLGVYERPNHAMPFLNIGFGGCLLFILFLVYGGRLGRQILFRSAADVTDSIAHGVLAILMALELRRWGSFSAVVTPKMSINLISVAWAIQAFSLIMAGLNRNRPLLRYLGFALFAVTVGKVLLIDTSELEKVYRIVSFVGCGLLLVAAGYVYQRYNAKTLVERREPEKTK